MLTEVDALAGGAIRPSGADRCSDTPQLAIPGHRVADNDEAWSDAGLSRYELDAWAQHAFGSNGFVDVAAPLTTYELFQAARARRAKVLGDIIAHAFRAIGAIAGRVYAGYRMRRQARATYEALRRLDDRMLRDLGVDRRELRSSTADAGRTSDPEEVRIKWMLHGL
jgi:uncharacterized protein YjiS (DUF1127 family)